MYQYLLLLASFLSGRGEEEREKGELSSEAGESPGDIERPRCCEEHVVDAVDVTEPIKTTITILTKLYNDDMVWQILQVIVVDIILVSIFYLITFFFFNNIILNIIISF